MNFPEAVRHVLDIEGGYVFNKKDPGGETNFGISKRSYPGLDIKNLTVDLATEIYLRDFWLPIKADLLPLKVRYCLFDCAVNQGVGRAVKILQTALNVKVDGVLGVKTLAAANAVNENKLLEDIVMARFKHYISLDDKEKQDDPWDEFGKGWVKRLLIVTLVSGR